MRVGFLLVFSNQDSVFRIPISERARSNYRRGYLRGSLHLR